jgi:hypothetical protein
MTISILAPQNLKVFVSISNSVVYQKLCQTGYLNLDFSHYHLLGGNYGFYSIGKNADHFGNDEGICTKGINTA